MEKPGKKLKKFFIIAGTTGAVYAGLKYLLPLVAPFLAGYVLALMLRPGARFLSYRLHLKIKGKERHLPVGISGGLELAFMAVLCGTALYRGLIRLSQEIRLFMIHFPIWAKAFDSWLTEGCCRLERTLGLKPGCVAELAGEVLKGAAEKGRETAMPYLMVNSVTIIQWAVKAGLVCLVACLSAVLSLQEMEELRERRDQSLFRREFHLISSRLVQTGKAWFKSQGCILLLTAGLCTAGMFLLKNPYYIMAGIGIGILDALPILGTGTVLIPWALVSAAGGRWKDAFLLAGLYLLCYCLRQLLEARIMGGQVGLSSLETLAAVYVGLELFGFFGFILGPLGLLLIEDLVEEWAGGGKVKERDAEKI